MDVVVQPGVNWVTLNDNIKDTGLFLPMDPSPTVRAPFVNVVIIIDASSRLWLEVWSLRTAGSIAHRTSGLGSKLMR